MRHVRRRLARLAIVLALLSGALVVGSAPAQAVDCSGQTWPSTGSLQTVNYPGSNEYWATLQFSLTASELCSLQQAGPYLEIDFSIRNFNVPAAWEGYTVSGTNLPGAMHDVAFMDDQYMANPAVTRIYTSQLQAGTSYGVTLHWTADPRPGMTPYIYFVWTPSHWAMAYDPDVAEAKRLIEIPSCINGGNIYPEGSSSNPNEAWCIFPYEAKAVTLFGNKHFDGGVPNGTMLLSGFRWYNWSPSVSTGGITPPAGQPTQPPPSYPAAQMFIRGDSAVFARSGIGTSWTQETDAGTATKIASSSTGVQMLIAGDSSVWAKRGIGYGGWSQEAVAGNATAITVGGETQMFLRGDGAVFATNSIGSNWVQETEPGTATAIAVSSNGTQMIITSDAAIWAKNGISYGGWTTEMGPGNANAIAVGGDTQMFIRGDAAVFARTGIGTSWTQEASPGNANKIAASDTGLQMFLRGDAAVFSRYGVGTSWTQAVGPGNAWAIAAGGNTQLFARGDNALFATGCLGCGWTQETSPGNTQAIAAG